MVLVEVALVDVDRDPMPPTPAGLRSDAVDGLYDGAAMALSLYELFDVRDPRRSFHFQVGQIDGAPLDGSLTVEGRSLGLAALIATWSLLSGRAVRTGQVFTGVLGRPSQGMALRKVQEVASKVQEVEAAGALLVGPRANAEELSPSRSVLLVEEAPQALRAAFGDDWNDPAQRRVRSQDIKAVAQRLEQDYLMGFGGWAQLADRFERFANWPEQIPSVRSRALARAGACWTHINEIEQAHRCLQAAAALVENPRLRHDDVLVIHNHLAVFYRDTYQFEEGLQELATALKSGGDRNSDEFVNVESTRGQILSCQGRPEEGLSQLRRARDHYDENQDVGCGRNHTYVVDALMRAGRLKEAREEHALGTRHNAEKNAHVSGAQSLNRAFLDYALWNGELRALRGEGGSAPWERLEQQLQASPVSESLLDWPRIGLERVRGAVRLRRLPGRVERDEVRRAALGGIRQGHPLFAWHRGLVSVEAALSELERQGDPVLARQWLEEGLRWVPPFDSARRFFAPYLERIQQATDPHALLLAIKALLDAEQY
ncbi:tetratricopeptide repeat protein [Hyalangium gracile]|uniref:hypothetical protein n=1 Tax=Hyalangium gracile TaxID=394092 RepID=UPI001CCEB1C7|nr:hypothetical protein [Hyalangium gracile]